jgi:hypothetical protein
MKAAIHCGAHGTEEDRLLKSLLKDADLLLRAGTAVPGPGKYRNLLNESFASADAGGLPAQTGSGLWEAILGSGKAKRAVLSSPHFLGAPRNGLKGSRLYPDAAQRLQLIETLFPEDELELFLCIRDPGAFLPALLKKTAPQRVRDLLAGAELFQLRWSGLLSEIRQAVPSAPITVWCYEDLPFIWEDILRAMAALPPEPPLAGALDMVRSIMPEEAGRRLASYLNEIPDMSAAQKRRVTTAFLDKFALDDALEEELDLPGWTEELVETLAGIYEQDLEVIRGIGGVNLIEPGAA